MTTRPAPRATVIIASYCWPEALELSLASALAQTVDDIEILVIEDGSDTRSRAVVERAGDGRTRWLALDKPSGSQSGPNARGMAEARAPIIAYLGHDDLWHPEHLATLLDTLAGDVDLAHAITLMLGDGETTPQTALTGSVPWAREMFVPPSSIAHRSSGPRIGSWSAPGDDGWPVDYRFLLACEQRGARLASTGRTTVAKFPAAWRRDSYRTRDVTPQRQMAARLAEDPGVFGTLHEAALAAGDLGFWPKPPSYPPGVIADHNRRMKGLPALVGHTTRWTPTGLPHGPGWWPPERDAGGELAWTRPPGRSWLRLDAPGCDGPLGVRVVVAHALQGKLLNGLVIDVDGEVVACRPVPDRTEATVLEGWLTRSARSPVVEVGITADGSRPSDLDPASPDQRLLGVAIREIQLLPQNSGGNAAKAATSPSPNH